MCNTLKVSCSQKHIKQRSPNVFRIIYKHLLKALWLTLEDYTTTEILILKTLTLKWSMIFRVNKYKQIQIMLFI